MLHESFALELGVRLRTVYLPAVDGVFCGTTVAPQVAVPHGRDTVAVAVAPEAQIH